MDDWQEIIKTKTDTEAEWRTLQRFIQIQPTLIMDILRTYEHYKNISTEKE